MAEENWLLVLTTSEVFNSIFKITKRSKSISIYIPGYWENHGLFKNPAEIWSKER